MIQIYHNARCSTSRCGLKLLEASGKPFETVKYLKQMPSKAELESLLQKLGLNPIDLIRQKEAIWIENFKGKTLSDTMILEAIMPHPILLERPIVINGNKAVIGRPPEKILEII